MPRPHSRPPWWPQDEPWPPPRPRHRHWAPWRLGCFLAVMLTFAAGFGALAAALLAAAFGLHHVGHLPFLLALIPLALVAMALLRRARRWTRPMGILIEAAERVESGDYSRRVPEYGPPELRSVARAFNAMTSKLEAEQAQRRGFLAEVAHEMRTPLTIIRGQAEAIADGVYPANAAHLELILDAARQIEVLVGDLRTMALSDIGNLVLAREPVDPAVFVNETMAAFAAEAATAGVALGSEIAEGVPMVEADPARMRGVLGNLLANAIRHTPAGGSVRVGVSSPGSGTEVRISVADTGAGIDPDLKGRVFERFVKGPGSTGSGLGLAIARDVVAAHGGTIQIESEPGAGTTVSLTLPA